MSILGKIMSAVFGSTSATAAPSAQGTGPTLPAGEAAAASAPQAGVETAQAKPASGGASGNVDVAAILDNAAKNKGEKLQWRSSIVDLMKALDLDSSLSARKELAKDLHYTGDTNDSATMNVWLHKQVIAKLKENGGKVPAGLVS
ncbi:DUF3597 domain-containing protein [Chelatococcus reniformis]|uniref:DUF3597 domain-containing protein n=1 Tax=Chelatococcus reniformis TaxID=1494448 RepID=A0A916TWZ8_9HYPH|nr:DUF3597 domain-containing protein [Chelatococcus reniformis]GGC48350.1 hypothetical protein GCM10010994_04420 [Chelatococcus reniformis]